MTIGLIFPTCDIGSDPIASRDWVEAAGELGVGARWNRIESEALGAHWEDRGLRLSEQVDVLRRRWTELVLSTLGGAR